MWRPNAVGGQDGCPAVLFHGTKREHLQSIRARGLIPHWPEVDGEPDAVYLTDDLGQAVANSDGIDWQTETLDLDCLLVVDVTGLPLYRLSFYTCMQPIPPERITGIQDHSRLRDQLKEETGWLGDPVPIREARSPAGRASACPGRAPLKDEGAAASSQGGLNQPVPSSPKGFRPVIRANRPRGTLQGARF
jgi:hypothetical protein